VCSVFSQFEYQQAQLEAEIENLSWKIEHAETTDRGDLENQMDIAEKRRYGRYTERRKTERKKGKWTLLRSGGTDTVSRYCLFISPSKKKKKGSRL
jgi:hypothetical protein